MAFSALLDGCALFPFSLRDTLLRVAEAGIYRPRWSARILDEVRRNLVERYPDRPAERFDSMLTAMQDAFEDGLIEGYESLIDSMSNEPKDRHVLAAAVAGRVDVIVTHNIKDFPPKSYAHYGIDVQTPDEFLIHAFHLDPDVVIDVLRNQAKDKQAPPIEFEELLNSLEPSLYSSPRFADESRMIDAADEAFLGGRCSETWS